MKPATNLRGAIVNASNAVPPPIPGFNTNPIIPKYDQELTKDQLDYITKIYARDDITDEEGLEIQNRLIAATKASDQDSITAAYLDFAKYFYVRGKYSDALTHIDMGLNSFEMGVGAVELKQKELYSDLRGMRGVLRSHYLKLFSGKSVEEDLNIALAAQKKNPLFLRKKAILYDDKKAYHKSVKFFEAAYSEPKEVTLKNPDEIADYQIFLKNLAHLGSFNKLLYAYCERGLELVPDNADFIKYREEAVIQFAKNKRGKDFFDEAKKILQERLELDPHNQSLLFNLASVQMAEGAKDLAMQSFDKLIEGGQVTHEVRFKMGNMLVYGNEDDQNLAMWHYIEVLQSDAVESGAVNRDNLNHYARTIISRFSETVQKLNPIVSRVLIKKIEELNSRYPNLVDEKKKLTLERSKSVVELLTGNKDGVNVALVNDKLKNLREARAFTDILALTDKMIELDVLDSESSYIRGFALAKLGDFKNAYDSFVGSQTADGYYKAALISTQAKVGKTNSEKCALLEEAIKLSADEYVYHIALGSALLEERENIDYAKAHNEFKSAITSIVQQNSLKAPTAIVRKEQIKNLSQIANGLISFLNSQDHYDFAEDIAQELISIDENAFPQVRSVLKAVAVKRGADYELSAENHRQIDNEIVRKFSARNFNEVITMSKHMLESLDAEKGNDHYGRKNFYNFMLGKSYSRVGKFNESIIALDQVPLSYKEYHPDIFFEKGRAILRDIKDSHGRIDEAMSYYQEFLKYTIQHNATEAQSSKQYINKISAQISRIEDDVAKVIISSNSSLALDIAETGGLLDENLGVRSHKLVKASDLNHFRTAQDLKKAGNNAESLNELYKISNATADARNLADTGFYSAVGSMFFEARDYEKALEFYEKQQKFSVRLGGVFHERKGDIYLALKRPEEAVSEYVKAVSFNPNNLNLLTKAVEASEEAGKAPPNGYKERIETIQNGNNADSQVASLLIAYGFMVCSVIALALRAKMACKKERRQIPNSILENPRSADQLSQTNIAEENIAFER